MSNSIPTYPDLPTDRASVQRHTSIDLPTAASPSGSLSLLSFSSLSFVSQSQPSLLPLCHCCSHHWLPSVFQSAAILGCPFLPSLFPVRRDFVAPSMSPSAAVYSRLRHYFSFSSSTVHIRCRILNGFLVECTCPANPVIKRWLLSAERICRCVFRSTYPCPAS